MRQTSRRKTGGSTSGLLIFRKKGRYACILHRLLLFLQRKNNHAMQKLKSITPIEWTIFGLTTISILLIVAGFCLPPQGVVDTSVLASVGEMFAFAALLTGLYAIKHGKTAKVQHGETSITLGDDDEH